VSNIVEFPSRPAAPGACDVAAAIVRNAILREMQSRGIQRPDIAAAFGAKLKELLIDWERQPGLRFTCDSELSEATIESLQDGVSELRKRAAVAIAGAFTSAAASAIVASFDGSGSE
jgi:hypothetical protein